MTNDDRAKIAKWAGWKRVSPSAASRVCNVWPDPSKLAHDFVRLLDVLLQKKRYPKFIYSDELYEFVDKGHSYACALLGRDGYVRGSGHTLMAALADATLKLIAAEE